MLVTEITRCRSCDSDRLETVLDLGDLAISDFLLPGEAEEKAPLELVVCQECSLVQLRHTVDRNRLYRRAYWYRSGVNESMRASLQNVVDDVLVHADLTDDDVVIDIGSNDSTMLEMFPAKARLIGIEPSPIAEEGRRYGIEVVQDYFPWCADKLPKAKILTSIAQFYNVSDLRPYMTGIKQLLADDGVWCVQMAYFPATLATCNVGDLCHEHCTFWTLTAFERLITRWGLHIAAVSFNEVNGGSFRVMVKHGTGRLLSGDEVKRGELMQFVHQIEDLKRQTVQLLKEIKANGKIVAGLGASTKNNMILSYYDIGPELISCFAERSPEKWGRLTVNGIPIVSEETARLMRPDYYFVGPFHFLDSLKQREKAFLERGGQFIVPFPTLYTVGGERSCPYTNDVVYVNDSALSL